MFKKLKCLIDYREVEEDSEDEEAQLDEKLAELKEEEQKALKRWAEVVYMALHRDVISVWLNHKMQCFILKLIPNL